MKTIADPLPSAGHAADVLVLCEGQTEIGFCRAMIEHFGVTHRVLVHEGTFTEPRMLAAEARREAAAGRWAEIYCVFDHDDHPDVEAEIASLIRDRTRSVRVCDSYPCIEAFFVFFCDGPKRTFSPANREQSRQQQTYALLKLYCRDYRKGRKGGRAFFLKHKDKLDLAVARAKVNKEAGVRRQRPVSYSNLPVLIEGLERIAAESAEPQSVKAKLEALLANGRSQRLFNWALIAIALASLVLEALVFSQRP